MAATCYVLLERCDSLLAAKNSTVTDPNEARAVTQMGTCTTVPCYVVLKKCDENVGNRSRNQKKPEEQKYNLATRSKVSLSECMCGETFTNRALLLKHINSHREKGPSNETNTISGNLMMPQRGCLRCSTCNQFEREEAVRKNGRLLVHNRQQVCSKCGCKCATEIELAQHSCTELTVKPYRCNFCDATFSFTRYLRKHVSALHMTPPIRHKCRKCKSVFLHAEHLKLHYMSCKLSSRHKNGKKQSIISKAEKNRKNLWSKRRNVAKIVASNVKREKSRKPISGNTSNGVRGSVFESLHTEKRALRSSCNLNSQGSNWKFDCYKCLHCDATFGNIVYFKRHTESHRNLKLVHINDNEALDSWKKQLEANLGNIAEPESASDSGEEFIGCNSSDIEESMTYNCQSCSATFNNKLSLLKHERCHKQKSSYKCSYCDATFTDRKQLIHHIDTHHINIQPVDDHQGYILPSDNLNSFPVDTGNSDLSERESCSGRDLAVSSVQLATHHINLHSVDDHQGYILPSNDINSYSADTCNSELPESESCNGQDLAVPSLQLTSKHTNTQCFGDHQGYILPSGDVNSCRGQNCNLDLLGNESCSEHNSAVSSVHSEPNPNSNAQQAAAFSQNLGKSVNTDAQESPEFESAALPDGVNMPLPVFVFKSTAQTCTTNMLGTENCNKQASLMFSVPLKSSFISSTQQSEMFNAQLEENLSANAPYLTEHESAALNSAMDTQLSDATSDHAVESRANGVDSTDSMEVDMTTEVDPAHILEEVTEFPEFIVAPETNSPESSIDVCGRHSLKCRFCSFVSSQLNDMNQHEVSMHSRAEVTSCCDVAFTSAAEYELHVLAYHTESRYHCFVCNKIFNKRDLFLRHKKSHSRKKVHCCYDCEYRTYSKFNMNRHRTRVHKLSANS